MKRMSKGNYLDSNKTIDLALPYISTIFFFSLEGEEKIPGQITLWFGPSTSPLIQVPELR